MDSKNDKLNYYLSNNKLPFSSLNVSDYVSFLNENNNKDIVVRPGEPVGRVKMVLDLENKEKDENSSDVPELTIEVINKKIKQYEIITGMSFNEYKRACESGKIKNFSQVGLDLWELIEEQKKEIEQKEINTNE
ncbi:hypothetical protein C1N83_28110 (plasmid) [Priestia aryabhattai]